MEAGKYAFDFAYNQNKIEGRGGWSRQDTVAFTNYGRKLAVNSGLAGPGGANSIAQIGEEYAKSGLPMPTTKGMLKPTLQFARAGDITDAEAASYVISGTTIFRLPMKTESDARKSASRISDAMVLPANMTKANVGDVGNVFRVAGPFAAMMGLSPEQLGAYAASMVQAGLEGPEVGTALRSGLVRMLKQTNDSRQALAELGLNVEDYALSTRNFESKDLLNGIQAKFGTAKKGTKGKLDDLLSGGFSNAQDMRAQLTDFFINQYGAKGPQDKEKIAKAVATFISSQVEQLDVEKLFFDLQSKDPTGGYMARIFDQRQGGRLLALMSNLDIYEKIMAEFEKGTGQGSTERGAKTMMQGPVGQWNQFTASIQEVILASSESGAMADATEAMHRFAASIRSIAETMQAVEAIHRQV